MEQAALHEIEAFDEQWKDAENPKGSEKVRITADGDVGIRTTNPKRPLQIGATNQFPISFNGNYPDIHFNTYYESGWRIHTAGFGAKTTFNGATGAFVFSNVASAQTAAAAFTPVDRFSVLANGNFGIGISVPTSRLHVVGGDYGSSNGTVRLVQNVATNAPTLFLEQTGQGGNANNDQGLLIKVDGQNTGQGNIIRAIGTNSNVNGGNDVEALTVQNGGKVGIGTATPAANLHVKNTVTTTNSAVMVNRTETVFGWEEEWWFNARATSTSAGTAYLNFTFSGASTTNTHNMFIDYTFALYREHSTLGAIEGDSVHGTGSYQNNSSGGDVCRSGEAEVIGVGIVDNVYLEVTGSNAFRLAIVYEANSAVKNISGKIKLLNNPATGSSPVVSIAV